MSKANVIVLGGNFAGLTAALELKHRAKDDVAVTVISKTPQFLFVPSLIWVPFGKRQPRDLTFNVSPVLESHGVEFIAATATHIDTAAKVVHSPKGPHPYDYLLVATGFEPNHKAIPGIEPGANTYCITSIDEALQAGEGWKKFLDDPGPVVIGATQGAGCFGAAYEFLFNFAHEIKKRGLRRRAPLAFVTPEPFAGHFGIGGLSGGEKMLGWFFRRLGVEFIGSTAMKEVVPGEVRLEGGRAIPFKYGMIMPPFTGAAVIRQSPGLGDAKGLIPVKPSYEHETLSGVYAAGAAVAVNAPWQTPVPLGVPKTGYPAEQMASVAAYNIAARIQGLTTTREKPFGDIPAVCVMDAGNMGVIILSDKMLPPRKHEALIPGPQAHWAKVAFEKYYLWKMRHGYVGLP